MRSVQGSSRLGNLNAKSPRAMIRLLRTAGSTNLADAKCTGQKFVITLCVGM